MIYTCLTLDVNFTSNNNTSINSFFESKRGSHNAEKYVVYKMNCTCNKNYVVQTFQKLKFNTRLTYYTNCKAERYLYV